MLQKGPAFISTLQPLFYSLKDMRAVTTKDEERGSSEPVSNWNKQTSGISLGDDRAPTATCNIPSFQTSTEDGSQCVAIGQAADRQSRPRKVIAIFLN